MRRAATHRRLAVALLLAAGLGACEQERTVTAKGELVVESQGLDFGDVPVLQVRTATIELKNVGRANLLLERAAIQEADSPFAVALAPSVIEPGTSAFVEVRFTPAALAPYSATLLLDTDDEVTPHLALPLAGRGFTVARLEADAALDFDRTCEGGEAILPVTLRSTGTADLVIAGLRFAEGSAPEFSFVSSTRTPITVPQGGELRLSVRFAPTAASPERPQATLVLDGVTDPDHQRVEIALTGQVNRAPAATIGEVPISAPGQTVVLDGSSSADPDGDTPLTWLWSRKSSPIGSRAAPSPLDEPTTSVALDLPGRYTLALEVRDAQGCASAPAFREVFARPAEQLLVELVWDNAKTDLDLHMTPGSAPFFGPEDCYYADGHRQPDWGVIGVATDDPALDRDALTGYGPEIITYAAPAAGRYEVMVHFYNDNRARPAASGATLRVYEFGVVKAELRRTLEAENQQWRALSIEWPSGAITVVDTVQ